MHTYSNLVQQTLFYVVDGGLPQSNVCKRCGNNTTSLHMLVQTNANIT
jgi:hypothetical protein